MSQLGAFYEAFKADGFKPRLECIGFSGNSDLSILFHYNEPDAQPLVWLAQWQSRNGLEVNPYWSLTGRWILK